MPEIVKVSKVPWKIGGRPAKYDYIYNRLVKPGSWYVVTFATVAEVETARHAILAHAKRSNWVVKTTEHIDHIIPRCQNGNSDPDNLAASCASCNCSKGGRTPEEAGMELR